MAKSKNRSLFNEATRVQMPALVHLTRIGYSYFGKITEDMAGSIYDPDTNILINVFKEQFAKLNPDRAGDAETMLRTIRQELDNDDIGESFYKRLKAVSPVRLIDFEHPSNNTYHCTAEFTCKRDEDEFRPDITLFINGLPLVFIEVKKPNNIGGMVAEAERMNKQRFPFKTPCEVTGSCADCKSDDCICNQILITRNCRPAGRIKFILVGEELGF